MTARVAVHGGHSQLAADVRKASGLSMSDFGDEINVTSRRVSEIEGGDEPTGEEMDALSAYASILGISLDPEISYLKAVGVQAVAALAERRAGGSRASRALLYGLDVPAVTALERDEDPSPSAIDAVVAYLVSQGVRASR
jgi:transcriptional regulator with XRE-family HTH domain